MRQSSPVRSRAFVALLSAWLACALVVAVAAWAVAISRTAPSADRRRRRRRRRDGADASLRGGGEEASSLSAAAVPRPLASTEVLHADPMILRVADFLSADECAELVREAERAGFAPSTVQERSTERSLSRTSTTCNLAVSQTPLVRRIEERFAALTGESLCRIEPLQVTRYESGQFYRPHYDFFLPHALRPVEFLGQRSITVFCVLNDLPAGSGGDTRFPKLGLTVPPRRGAALWWSNTLRSGQPDHRTLHEGTDVREGAVKYGLNIWARFHPWPERSESAVHGRFSGGRSRRA